MSACRWFWSFVLVIWLVAPAATALPDEAAIRAILAERDGLQRKSVGMVVGVIDAGGRRVVGHGSIGRDDARVPDGATLFEIGSVSKVFTTTLLADLVRRGRASLDDPVGKFLPESVKMPSRDGGQITLRHLATHGSGLYRMPSNLKPSDPANPFADYSTERLYEYLSKLKLSREIGGEASYSNLGMGLLGHALSLEADSDYEALVREKIAAPLGMKDTVVTLDEDQRRRLATGHNAFLTPVPNWDMASLAGAGALRSTADDMLRFLAANMGLAETPLAPTLADTQVAQRSFRGDDTRIGLGWILRETQGAEVVCHDGMTGGYASFVGFDKKSGLGVVVLSNTSVGVGGIGFQLLEDEYEPARAETAPASEATDDN